MNLVDLNVLGRPERKRIAARVTRDAERQIRSGHPWVFDESISSLSHNGRPGDLAVVFDHNRDFLAIGLYDPRSPIRIKLFNPRQPTNIDNDFWLTTMAGAIDRRTELAQRGTTTGYRVVNGENDGMPGLIVDLYDTTVVVKIYTEAWLPHLGQVTDVIAELLDPDRVVLRLGRLAQQGVPDSITDGAIISGDLPSGPVLFRENGLVFEADVIEGQKTGHFLDQRDNRAAVGQRANGAKVIDVFACTGGFSVYAAAGGASQLLAVDSSPGALATAQRNIDRNAKLGRGAQARFRARQGDAFEVMADLARQKETFDLIVIDPPSFAHRASDVGPARQSYRRLTRAGLALAAPGALLVQASCSSRVTTEDFVDDVLRTAEHAGRPLTEVGVTGHAVDHPVTFPQGSYLKAVFGRVE